MPCVNIWDQVRGGLPSIWVETEFGSRSKNPTIQPAAQADFFTCPQNSISFPRCCGGTHVAFLRNLFGV